MSARVTQVQAVLNELGNLSPEGIAEMLHREGYRGRRRTVTCCPLARYFERRLGFLVDVAGHVVWVQDEYGDTTALDTPRSVADFVHRFDNGEFPFLDEEAECEGGEPVGEVKTKVTILNFRREPVWQGEVLGDGVRIHIRNKIDVNSYISFRDVEAVEIEVYEQ